MFDEEIQDSFSIHFEKLHPEVALLNESNITDSKIPNESSNNTEINNSKLSFRSENFTIHGMLVSGTKSLPKSQNLLSSYKIKSRLLEKWCELYSKDKHENGSCHFSSLQEYLFPIINGYNDLFFSSRTWQNSKELMKLYILHALNHILKTRDRVIQNNAKLSTPSQTTQLDIEFKDQGFTRPKVLLLLPFRNCALEAVRLLVSLAPKLEQDRIANKKRFFQEFSEEPTEPNPEKPRDFTEMFYGNTDDCFRVGISFTRKTVKLYSDFYSSDIIIASPLGLRMAMGAPSEKFHDHDFLSSIELVIVDQW